MVNIEIYTKISCPYCHRAKLLLVHKQLPFQEILIDSDIEMRNEMIKRTGRSIAPQIFINGKHIGGYDALQALNVRGDLDPLIK